MIIQKPEYKINAKTGKIIKRQIIELSCDKCKSHWETAYEHIKRMKYSEHLCPSCRAKERWKNRKPNQKSIKITCKFCHKKIICKPYYITKTTCCSKKCAVLFANKIKYQHLASVFKKYENEVSYLVGLILGDGHLKKTSKFSTRVSIAFDNHKTELINLAKSVFKKLKINYFEEPLIHKNCKMIGFILPDELLKNLGILYNGDKFKNQPFPNNNIINNINYAAGLINSDGHVSLQSNDKPCYIFTNTVLSIVKNLEKCLENNDIKYTHYSVIPKIDKRTNKINKRSYRIHISRQRYVNKLKTSVKFKLKEYYDKN